MSLVYSANANFTISSAPVFPTLVVSLVLLLISPLTAKADGYFGIGLGRSLTNIDIKVNGLETKLEESDSSIKFYAGWEYNNNWSIEGALIDFGTPSAFINGADVALDVQGLELSARYFHQIAERTQFFAKAGLLFQDAELVATIPETEIRASSFDGGGEPMLGAGFSFMTSDHVSLRLEAQIAKEGDGRLMLFSLGVEYRTKNNQ